MQVTNGSFRLDLKSGEVTAKRLGANGAERRALRAAQSAPPASVAGVPEPQFRSADGRYVMHPEQVADDTVWDKYLWTVYDAAPANASARSSRMSATRRSSSPAS